MKHIYFTCFLILINCSIFGQLVEGIVVDDSKSPIQLANIYNSNTGQHTHSNNLGKFALDNCSIGDSLQFSVVGYKTKTVIISDINDALSISLSEIKINLKEIVISPETNGLRVLTDLELQINPVTSSEEILQKLPGLFIGQHAGGGKAEQIFLRGFDIDHGTDINLSVDGLPVNMVSHAHGQGYADLHFLIPETIEKIDFGKGPYYQNKGNFTTAGYVSFSTKEKLENNIIKLEAGQFNTQRLLGMFNVKKSDKQNAYVASEYISTDGYFESPQNFKRINLFGKYNAKLNTQDKIGIIASHFESKWDASGQIPERAVNSGLIGRFGAIDDTEGGQTSRTNLALNYNKILTETSSIQNKIYLSKYDFQLFSNFTFYLEDQLNGDQIKQREDRIIYGLTSDYMKSFIKGSLDGTMEVGINLRNDQSRNNELSRTANRKSTLEQIQLGDINETNIGAYFGTTVNLKKWTFNPSIRLDYFDVQYHDKLMTSYKNQEEATALLSPKFNIFYNPNNKLQLYLKTGKGFHSNDTRVVVAENGKDILPAAYGIDVGYIWKPIPKIFLNMAYWHLYLEQEFVYVGDAGIVEPSGKTKRQGLELSCRYQPFHWLFWNLDANYTKAQSIDSDEGTNFIPLAPDFTMVNGINFIFNSSLFGSINVRHLSDRPANENNSIVAKGYTVTDLNVGYNYKNMSIGFQIQNLFNQEWNETQFATNSRLLNEAEPTEEIHFTPGTPLFIKGSLAFNF